MSSKSCVLVQVIVLCASTVIANMDSSDFAQRESSWEFSLNSLGLSPLYKLYHKCMRKDATTTMEECLSTQVVVLMDQMVHKDRVPIVEGIEMVSKPKQSGRSFGQEAQPLTEETLEATLPRSLEARQETLDSLIVDRASNFFQSHTLHVDLPTGRGLRRGAMKIKKLLLPFLMGVVLKAASIIPVILSVMGVLAMKALLASKGALILTGLIGLRRILHQGHQAQHKGSHHHQMFQHDLGFSSLSHGLANLMHGLGTSEHQYGHGHADSHGSGSNVAQAVMYGRSFDSAEGNQLRRRSDSVQKAKRLPFSYPGLTKTLVVTA
ncbi:uncharacterized protein [Periplaneta americana]|uniref:uncharacterized protein n=1 Tax=Periplaneta americana TaxID=6978 RepID=UPI0037E8247D